ncbi:3503_t:CDS:1 [Paraglomus brasilianum]|uniref:3503_t:CDS:1 n=1 Tax=Paraglomus brasilianum TaxID=144538 RepID=A0A9N9A641_9GLOM|nr:3503_t:CDS:1 [Paraglomus brasilianum]
MPVSNIEEKLELAKNKLLELDREESLIEESTPSERTTPESTITENTTTEKSRKIVVFSDVSLERYRKFRGEGELKKSNIYVRLVKGEVIAYEAPSSAHGFVALELAFKLKNWSNQLNVISEQDITTGNNSEYCADVVAEPRQIPPPAPGYEAQPTIIIEVAKSETLSSLNDLAPDYFSASTQIYLAIKIFPRRQDSTAAMLAILYLRNNQVPNQAANVPNPPPNISPMIVMANTIPNIAISFGTAPINYQRAAFIKNTGIRNDRLTGFVQSNDIPCTRAGMQNYQITIPANLLFPGGVPVGVPNNFVIDLWEVQQNALYYLVCIAFTLL